MPSAVLPPWVALLLLRAVLTGPFELSSTTQGERCQPAHLNPTSNRRHANVASHQEEMKRDGGVLLVQSLRDSPTPQFHLRQAPNHIM